MPTTAALRAVLHIDSEHALEQGRPTYALLARWRRNDRSAQLGVGCEHAKEANQMQPWTRDQCR
jgi:hypothetical protein